MKKVFLTVLFAIRLSAILYLLTSIFLTASARCLAIRAFTSAFPSGEAEGQGVGNMFEEPDWNRVSICIIHEN